VLDHLKADDYRVLRQFQGKAKLTTYLTTAVSNLVIDLVRKKKGRSRAKERAQEMGEVAAHLYDAVYCRGYSLGEAQCFLQATWGITASHAELGIMLERIRGRETYQTPAEICEVWPHTGKEIVTKEGLEISIADPARSAEQMLADDQRERSARRVLEAVLEELSGEERLILSLRFPKDDFEEPKANREIAQMLHLTEKAVDNRIRRILKHCRQMILEQGLSLSDLIDAGK
jgi:RNA polymerase sigma factor (sigma-70 family)